MREKIQKEERDYVELKRKADTLIASNPNIETLSNKDLNVILRSLKRKEDKKLPTKKKEMIQLYNEWKDRKERQFDYSVIKLNITGTINEENDAVVNNDEVVEI